jgi:phosphoglycerate dehydrogenase-like enzyme
MDHRWTIRPPLWPGGLRWLHLRSSGIDEYPHWVFDVPLINSGRGSSASAIAEFVFAAMLGHEKQLPQIWISGPEAWARRSLGTLEGKTLGLLGLGNIGAQLAIRAKAFNMVVKAHRRRSGMGAPPGVEVTTLDQVLRTADHLAVVLPLTDLTRGLLDESAFAKLKPGVHFVNVARGAIVDQTALRDALDTGRISAASLDVSVPEPPPAGHWLYTHPKVRLSPHIAASSPGSAARYRDIFLESLDKYMRGDTASIYGLVERGVGY